MSQVTLEMVQARQRDLAAMIEELQQRQVQTIQLPACTIALRAGEWYAGAVLNSDGSVQHHTIVAASDNSGRNFDDTQAWAQEQGHSAPTKQEAALIVANRHERLSDMAWFWLNKPHESESAYAWGCDLDYGIVVYTNRSAEGGAVAVRRLIP